MANQYTLSNHTILPLIFKFFHANSLAYVIKDPQTSSLILFHSGYNDTAMKTHLQNIEEQTKCKLAYRFLNVDCPVEKLAEQQIISPASHPQLKPIIIGDISVCLIGAPGYSKDYSLIGVTHMTPTSTKLPVLFTGSMVGVSCIDTEQPCPANKYMESLAKLKYFPNETYVFPSRKVDIHDLRFSNALQENPLLDQKITMAQKMHFLDDKLIPTTVVEEKMLNPFLAPEKHKTFVQAKSAAESFEKLRVLRRQWKKEPV